MSDANPSSFMQLELSLGSSFYSSQRHQVNLCPESDMSNSSRPKLAYTVEEAAEMLSLSRAHLYRLIDLQQIGSVTIGRSRRITSTQLSQFISTLEGRATVPQRYDRLK